MEDRRYDIKQIYDTNLATIMKYHFRYFRYSVRQRDHEHSFIYFIWPRSDNILLLLVQKGEYSISMWIKGASNLIIFENKF